MKVRLKQAKGDPEFPLESKRGVKIYKGSREKGGRRYDEFTVVWTHCGKRVRRSFADLAAAKTEQELADRKIADGEIEVLSIAPADRAEYLDWKAQAAAIGKPASSIFQEYRDWSKRLEGRAGIGEAVDYYVTNYDRRIIPKPLPEVADELLKRREANGRSKVHLETLSKHFRHLKEAFPGRIDRILHNDLERFLQAWSGRTRNNVRASMINLFGYAKKSGYLSPDRETEAQRLDRATEAREAVEIFSPAECRKLLDWYSVNRPDLAPTIAIGLFAGARTSEIRRLDWKDIRIGPAREPHIELAAKKTKTRARRLVPIQPVLAAWLAAHRKESGPVCPLKRPEHKLSEYAERAGVEWKHNAMRHSFISYRIAALKSDRQVASEAGNSEGQVHKSYREIVTEEDAKAFWALFPKKPEGEIAEVIPMQGAAAQATAAQPISTADQSKPLRTDHGAPTHGAQAQ